jgi:hypothetical protein
MGKSEMPPLFISAHGRYYVAFFLDESTVNVREYVSSKSIGTLILEIEIHGCYIMYKHTLTGNDGAKIKGTLAEAIDGLIDDSVNLRAGQKIGDVAMVDFKA